MDAQEIEQRQQLIRETKRRLYKLEEQVARLGSNCPPEILIEIEDLQEKLKGFQQQTSEQQYRERIKEKYAEEAEYYVALSGEAVEAMPPRLAPKAPRSARRRLSGARIQ